MLLVLWLQFATVLLVVAVALLQQSTANRFCHRSRCGRELNACKTAKSTFNLQLSVGTTPNLRRTTWHATQNVSDRETCGMRVGNFLRHKKSRHRFYCPRRKRGTATTAKGQRQDSTTMRVQQRMEKKEKTITKPSCCFNAVVAAAAAGAVVISSAIVDYVASVNPLQIPATVATPPPSASSPPHCSSFPCHSPPAPCCQCPLHFILLLSTLARAVNKATWLLTRLCSASLTRTSLSLSPVLCFLIFMHCSCLALFTFVFRVFWWLAKFNFDSICSQQQQQQREQPLISWLSWKALKSMLQISVSNSFSFFPLSLCGLKLIGILQLTR